MDDLSNTYYREQVYRQEDDGKWVEYYAILNGKVWVFNGKTNRGRNAIDIHPDANCAYGEKNDYRFPFWVQTGQSSFDSFIFIFLAQARFLTVCNNLHQRTDPKSVLLFSSGTGGVEIMNMHINQGIR